MPVTPSNAARPSRISNVTFVFALAVVTALLADSVWFDLDPATGHIKGVEYLLVIPGAAYLIMAVWYRRLARKLALSITAGVAAVAVLEAVLTLAAPTDRPSWYVWPPGYAAEFRPGDLAGVRSPARFTINRRGIRGPDFDDADTRRILCIGGSTTECLYLDDDRTWPALLRDALRASDPHVWVGNVGRSGLTTFDHVTLAEHLAEADMVDTWLVMCGVNDLHQQLAGTYNTDPHVSFERTFSYRRPGLRLPLTRPFHRNLFIYQITETTRKVIAARLRGGEGMAYQDVRAVWVGERRQALRNAPRLDALPDLDAALDTYEQTLTALIETARRKGKRLVLVTQPTIWSAQTSDNGLMLAGGRALTSADAAKGMAMFNDRMLAVAQREGIACIDLAAALPKSVATFYDAMHFNEPGAKRAAQVLAGALTIP